MLKRRKDLKGIEKIAVLLLTLGPDLSASLMKRFAEAEIEKISLELSNTASVSGETISNVTEEFLLLCEARQYMLSGGLDYAKEVLEKSVGPQKAAIMVKKLKEMTLAKPFGFARKADPRQLVNIIGQEHPQTIALILSYIDATQSAVVLSALSPELQADIARRIAVMERTSPEVLREVEKVLDQRLSAVFTHDFTQAGGIASIVDILNLVDRATEKHILEELERQDTELTEEIRKRMFVFEDIVALTDRAIQRVIREVDSKDLALALKGVNDEVTARIFKNVSQRGAEMLKEDLSYMGPVRLREVEEAQQRIVAIIRRLDESGEILIARGGEDSFIE